VVPPTVHWAIPNVPPQPPPVVWQVPLMQRWPVAHFFATAPQLFGSARRSIVHAPVASAARFGRHCAVPLPAQYCGPPTAFELPTALQPPQFCGSSSVSVHSLLQTGSCVVVEPGRLAHAQALPEHVASCAHFVPHPPQLFGSFVVFVHWPAHVVAGAAQTQPPLLHVPPGPHEVPHVPQLAGSVFVLVQVPPHIESGAAQTQAPLTHVSPAAHL
jgi:hypothetical protein